jgi:hypothetical protein
MEGSKPTHGKGNRVLHPELLSEKGGVGSPAKAREGNRVLQTKLLNYRLSERFFPEL